MTDVTDNTVDPEPSENSRPIDKFIRSITALREASGYSRESAAASTRISASFVQALEEGRFEDLPGKVFVRGFIKNLCKTYGADPTETLEHFDGCPWGPEDPTTDLVPAVSRQDYKKTSNVVRLQKNKRKPSFLKQIHWQTFSKTMVLYFAVPIIGLATILFSLKAIQIETVVGWVDQAKLALSLETVEVPSGQVASKPGRLPLDIALMQNASPLEWQNVISAEGLTAKERMVESGYVGQMAKDAFDAKALDALAAKPAPAAPVIPAKKPEIVDSAVAKVEASARVPATVPAQSAPAAQATQAKLATQQEPAQEEPFTASLQKVGELANGQLLTPNATRSVITLKVLEPVKVRFKTAGKKRSKTMTLTPDTYQYPFATTLETLIFDASKVSISFNGKNLGNIGSKGRVRKITFHHKKSSADR